jgi:hypothetical protein
MTIFRSNSVLCLALLLCACSEKISDEDLICRQSPGYIEEISSNSKEQRAVSEQCIHKWAYRFGRAPGSNAEIAKAVIAKCREGIRWIQTYKIREGFTTKHPFTDAMWQEDMRELEEYALIRVTEGRAGNCPIRGADQK